MLNASLKSEGTLVNTLPPVIKLRPTIITAIEAIVMKNCFLFLNINFPKIITARIILTNTPIKPPRDVLPNNNQSAAKNPIQFTIL
ncbi:hypothetical protein CNEONATC25_03618 [Clostridium neonatale]|uniref:Uncharacterized protein n=1 Tax=Clostridium neonatale TaxID=137838 RepID=A0A653AVY1_9CLOT|nr:hypothetical protein CNEONATNEC32_03567 [Clostridium neonatale]SUQ53767.1 hypothetical protein CNEONATC25_03618 [Clostridium neonatale]SUQ54485.1 hypothetical protein CNEONATNEC26_03543 [Clostridium neonatale]VCT85987.1 hypothetical protein CNEONATNEC25_03590 [Clostridium neonatale]